jgi:hypothetical protein
LLLLLYLTLPYSTFPSYSSPLLSSLGFFFFFSTFLLRPLRTFGLLHGFGAEKLKEKICLTHVIDSSLSISGILPLTTSANSERAKEGYGPCNSLRVPDREKACVPPGLELVSMSMTSETADSTLTANSMDSGMSWLACHFPLGLESLA